MNRRQLLSGIAAIAVVGCKKTEASPDLMPNDYFKEIKVLQPYQLEVSRWLSEVIDISDLPICGMPTSVLLNGERFEIVNNADQFHAI